MEFSREELGDFTMIARRISLALPVPMITMHWLCADRGRTLTHFVIVGPNPKNPNRSEKEVEVAWRDRPHNGIFPRENRSPEVPGHYFRQLIDPTLSQLTSIWENLLNNFPNVVFENITVYNWLDDRTVNGIGFSYREGVQVREKIIPLDLRALEEEHS